MAGVRAALILPAACAVLLSGCDVFYACNPASHRCEAADSGAVDSAAADGGTAAESGPPCQRHEQCPSTVCDEYGVVMGKPGQCVPADQTAQVHSSTELQAALPVRRAVRLLAGEYTGDWEISDRGVLLVGPGAVPSPRPVPPDAAMLMPATRTALAVLGRARVALDGILIYGMRGANGDGILCDSLEGRLWLRRVEVEGNDGYGVWARCPALVTQSRIGGWEDGLGNGRGGLLAESDLTATNTYFANNGSTSSPVGGLVLSPTLDLAPHYFFTHLTFYQNQRQAAGSAVLCLAPATIWHSLFAVKPGTTAEGIWQAQCVIQYPAVLDPTFRSDQDLHLSPESSVIDQVPLDSAMTLDVDYDDEARPFGPANDIGADEFHPTPL